jgi:hypothetical protein
MGGLAFGRSMLVVLHERGLIKMMQHEETYLDEALGWTVALAGVYFQLSRGCVCFLPFSTVLVVRLCFGRARSKHSSRVVHGVRVWLAAGFDYHSHSISC